MDYGWYGQHNSQIVHKPSKQEIINWFKNSVGCSELDMVDVCDEEYARHICMGGRSIELLPRQYFNAPMPDGGVVVLEYYRCNLCGKVILNRNFM